MTSTNKQIRRSKNRLSACSQTLTLVDQLKVVIKSLNDFLKKYFDRSMSNVQQYANLVRQYFIHESTNSSYSCAVGSLFSKISNMLQPFIQPKSIKNQQQNIRLKQEVSSLQLKIQKSTRKIRRIKQQLNQYKQTSSRLTSFIYMLRVNNIDVDLLYQRGCQGNGKKMSNAHQLQIDVQGQSRTQGLRSRQGAEGFVTN